jgi:flagellar hook protein FlgE
MFAIVDLDQPNQKFYTRDGSFSVSAEGLISNAEGMALMSSSETSITVPMTVNNTALTGVSINNDGSVNAAYGIDEVLSVGQVGLATFADPNRLTAIGQNLFKENASSGEGVLGGPVSDGRGKIHSGALEMSNIDMTSELTNLMRAQQAFSGSSRLMQAETEMARKFTQ